ncbi:hypothetical protein VE03_03651 [Pseudogymnoascus sp. 23342-1-I1]|nr:hypothetical protein VE03_03602 [Pseudogymnoascus sp. 23342-1-I1]OBT66589.1 hypothetical protein VE03_03651 [Pseudogymnoascus sp. 23342-1-I1]
MEKTPESVAQEITAIRQSLKEVSAAVDRYAEVATKNVSLAGTVAAGEVSESHTRLFMESHKFMRTARGPLDMVFSHTENSSHSGALRAVMEMGVFDAIPVDGSPTTATELAQKLNVDKDLLVRLMRCVTIIGPFAELGPEKYAHTAYSKMYLVPEIKGLFKLMYDEFAPPNSKMYEFFREQGFRTPNSEVINPYCFAHKTGDQSIWEYLGQRPDRLGALNFGMAAQSEAAAWTVGIFPFASELRKAETTDETVLLIDIGGGKGHVTKQIKALTEGIRGKIILQERPEVLTEITDPLTGIEKMEYDFFTPQTVKGAKIYYIRRCLHDWSDTDCVRILKNTASAMTPGVSRLLISEIVLPSTNADVEAMWMDMTMLTVSGSERDGGHWSRLLAEAGLKMERTYHAPGTNYGAVEAYLA